MIGLIDCNNFFVSCERVFRPEIAKRPVVVMSNNDGCAVAMSNEAKALGIKRGVPVYQIKELIRRHNVVTFSGNHKLYGDMSSRVIATIASIVPELEVYSVDECFIDFSGFNKEQIETLGHQIVTKIRRDVGIPTSLGIAPTKTLAKIASHFAKKYSGYRSVCIIDSEEKRIKALELTPINGIWGIGRRLSKRLTEIGITNAAGFAELDHDKIQKIVNISGERTWRELNGEPCIDIELIEPERKQLCCSRSFSDMIDDINRLREAISYFCDNVGRKLRKQNSCAGTISVFIQTNTYRTDLPQHIGNGSISFEEATNDTIQLTQAAIRLLERQFKKGYSYKRAGVFASDICNCGNIHQSLFISPEERDKRQRLMNTIDTINHREGSIDKIHLATATSNRGRVRQEELSPLYSTSLADIITVKAK